LLILRLSVFFTLRNGAVTDLFYFQICPSANNYDCRAMAIGARSQSAKTYLERHLEEFLDSDLDALVAHGLRALRDTLPNEIELNSKVLIHK
jgi:20S proteasome subunit alpha 6